MDLQTLRTMSTDIIISIAASTGDLTLLDHGLSRQDAVQQITQSAIIQACSAGHSKVLKILIDNGAMPAQFCLYIACLSGHKECAQVLLEYGLTFDANTKDICERKKHHHILELAKLPQKSVFKNDKPNTNHDSPLESIENLLLQTLKKCIETL